MVWKMRPWMACSFRVRNSLSITPFVFERRLGLLPPLLELEQRQAELAREQLGGLAAHQPQHHLALARRTPALTGRQWASAACGQRGRAAPALADHRPISRIKRIDL